MHKTPPQTKTLTYTCDDANVGGAKKQVEQMSKFETVTLAAWADVEAYGCYGNMTVNISGNLFAMKGTLIHILFIADLFIQVELFFPFSKEIETFTFSNKPLKKFNEHIYLRKDQNVKQKVKQKK